jgi:trans-aconitate methyltransferase
MNIDETARIYKSKFVNGWEQLYKTKRKKLYDLLSEYYVGSAALELGCGDGESTKNIISFFDSLDIVDGSNDQLIKIREKFNNVNTIHSYFEDFTPLKKYDTIFMTHILEHLEEPKLLLAKVYEWLNDNGVVLISVPNALSLHRLVGVKMGLLGTPYSLNEQDLLLGHRRVYDKDSMNSLIEETPFKIKKFTGLMLKPISNRQIEENWSSELIDAYFELGFEFPEHCSEIIFILEKND